MTDIFSIEIFTDIKAPIAQLVEHPAFNRTVWVQVPVGV